MKYKTNLYVKPDIQNDIYHLICKDYYVGVAAIQDYNNSVMMNTLFRRIKENDNLDLLEESDDEEEFENINEDKYVSVDTIYPMECEFIPKFQKWKPIKVVDDKIHNVSFKRNLPISV